MKRFGRICAAALILGLLLSLTAVPAFAAERESYTYTVRFFAGGQGSFGGSSVIVMDGLKYGEQVSFNNSMVSVDNASKYYVRGIRESGKDNNTVSQSSFPVTGDADYVVAYGILGDAVAYTVNYVDGDGNPLQPDDGFGNLLPATETYYGNVGDRVIVAYRQVVGYEPQTYNLAKTLSENAAENVFTFVYNPVPETPGGAAGTPPAAEEPGGPAAGPGGPGGEEETIPEDQVPEGGGPTQIEDLDEDDTPLGMLDIGKDLVEKGAELLNGLPFGARLGLIGLDVVVIALIVWLIVYRRKKKRKES